MLKLKKLIFVATLCMEVHQNEVKQLKSDLSLIGTRMDYQYNDRFKRIEEAVESSANKIYHIETSIRENSERFSGGQGLWKALVLNSANIVVEILKIFLYLIAFILDFIRNFFVTRNRAILLIISCIVIAVLWDLFDISNKINKFFMYFAYKTEAKFDSKKISRDFE